MRISVEKHYKELAEFVRLANLAWDEILHPDEFPTFGELEPNAKHRQLLKRIGRRLARIFPSIVPLSEVPPFYLPRWNQCSRSQWRQLHAFALVRRVFDSLQFLARRTGIATVGGCPQRWCFSFAKKVARLFAFAIPTKISSRRWSVAT